MLIRIARTSFSELKLRFLWGKKHFLGALGKEEKDLMLCKEETLQLTDTQSEIRGIFHHNFFKSEIWCQAHYPVPVLHSKDQTREVAGDLDNKDISLSWYSNARILRWWTWLFRQSSRIFSWSSWLTKYDFAAPCPSGYLSCTDIDNLALDKKHNTWNPIDKVSIQLL